MLGHCVCQVLNGSFRLETLEYPTLRSKYGRLWSACCFCLGEGWTLNSRLQIHNSQPLSMKRQKKKASCFCLWLATIVTGWLRRHKVQHSDALGHSYHSHLPTGLAYSFFLPSPVWCLYWVVSLDPAGWTNPTSAPSGIYMEAWLWSIVQTMHLLFPLWTQSTNSAMSVSHKTGWMAVLASSDKTYQALIEWWIQTNVTERKSLHLYVTHRDN